MIYTRKSLKMFTTQTHLNTLLCTFTSTLTPAENHAQNCLISRTKWCLIFHKIASLQTLLSQKYGANGTNLLIAFGIRQFYLK